MSRFVTLVLVPKDSSDIPGSVSALLAPFNDNIKVAPYDADCFCIGGIARQAGRQIATREVGDFDNLRERYWQLPAEEHAGL